MNVLVVLGIALWVYVLTILHRGSLHFQKFIVGSVGLFLFLLILFRNPLVVLLSQAVTMVSGILGNATGYFEAFTQYALVFINTGDTAISMYIDYECSGVIEIMAYTSLLWFFPVYTVLEKLMYSLIGILWIFLANILRIFAICTLIYYFGNNIFYFAHTIFGRMIFYGFSIVLYFHIFTKAQIKRQKVGSFSYEHNTR